jgi:murein DD-endopeptidase MepM/ murein hydrolase activator NlpD
MILMVSAVLLALAQAVAPIQMTVSARALQPGELLVVTLDLPPDATDVSVTVFGRTTTAFKLKGQWSALVGIDLDRRPGAYTMRAAATVRSRKRTGEKALAISAKRFETRKLTVAPAFVNPPASEQKRIAQDAALIQQVYAASDRAPLWDAPFVRPVADPANSRFGSRSIFNGEARSPHAGTDFLSPQGTPVLAPNAGRIVLARDLFFTGQTIILDHGLDVFSTFAHLSAIDVVEGAMVVPAQVLGKVGATGRVTGPHLHWALRVGGARVDALAVVALLGDGGALSVPSGAR